ncbi:unnamed protein product [Triticum turgidum subsp. durum]|uniref:Uncharacterized protein n=2 Tax=Triticum TaxID=4564 RepID=A0A9R1BRS7_TRITD|nr:unnamed protein product [Triticum turgidum subsp. durum]
MASPFLPCNQPPATVHPSPMAMAMAMAREMDLGIWPRQIEAQARWPDGGNVPPLHVQMGNSTVKVRWLPETLTAAGPGSPS